MTRQHLVLVVYCFVVGIIPAMLAILLYVLNKANLRLERRVERLENMLDAHLEHHEVH